MATLETVSNKRYENRRLRVDGGRFVQCHFIDSKLVYSATAEVSFEDCTFQNCEWVFEDAADRTLGYLSMLYRQAGIEGEGVVGATVESIRSELFAESMLAGPAERR